MGEIVDFIVVGGAKCGTHASIWNLEAHPDIWMAHGEPHYFDENFHEGPLWYLRRVGTKKWSPRKRNLERLSDDLKDRVLNSFSGEKTPRLLLETRLHPIIKREFPNVKLVAFLRNPIYRAYSHWAMKTNQREPFSLNPKMMVKPLERGEYVWQLESLFEHFPREQVHVAISEYVLKDMRREYNKIVQFFGLKRYKVPCIKYNVCKYRQRIRYEDWKRLHDHYKPYNERLFDLLGYEIPEWSQCPHLLI